MNGLQIFENPEFGKIRTVEVEGFPWLVGKDVAQALGYQNTNKAMADHVDDEDKMQGDGVTIRDPMGREQHPKDQAGGCGSGSLRGEKNNF